MERRRPRGNGLRLVLLACLSIGLMIVDHQSQYLYYLRTAIAFVVDPLEDLAMAPWRAGSWAGGAFRSEIDKQKDLERLRSEYLVVRARLQKMQAIEAENARLSRLLAASEKVGEEVLLADLVQVSLEPFTHKVLINRGARDSVYVGQPVIDPNGVVGQVTRTTTSRSAVTLLTDQSHAIPAQVRRNGLRVIVYGLGVPERLSVPYLPQHADIEEGDLLVTSGMGGRFPPGYPVARVARVVRDANEPFLIITALPVARLDHARELLLIWHGEALSGAAETIADSEGFEALPPGERDGG